MRVGLPIVISTALAAASLMGAPAVSAAPAAAQSVSVSVMAKKKAKSAGHLRVVITGSPRGNVHIKGPHTHRSISTSTMLKVRSGHYHLHASAIKISGKSYIPSVRDWALKIGKGKTTMVDVIYEHNGSSGQGSVGTDAPPAGMLGEVFVLVNQARSQTRQCGTKQMAAADPVVYDDDLAQAAQGHAEDMNANDYFEHDSLDGRTFADRIDAADYAGQPAGENIAMGFQSAAETVDGWLASPGHCENLMDPSFDQMGLGFASHDDPRYSTPVTYWVQDFGYGDAQ